MALSNEAMDAKARLEAELGDLSKPATEVRRKDRAKPNGYLARQLRLCELRLEMAKCCGVEDSTIAAYLRGAQAAFKLVLQAQDGKGEANLELPP